MSEARQMAEEGRRKQLKVLRDFEAGKPVTFAMHDNPSGYKLSRKDLPPERASAAPRTIAFASGEELMDCIAEDDEGGVQRLLDNGADVHYRDGDGMTPLHRACVEGNLRIVSKILEKGADPNSRDDDWWTPLHAAASSGGWRICNKLLEAGADPTAVNSDGDLPFDLCSDSRVEGVLQRELDSRNLAGKLDELRGKPEQTMLEDMQRLARTGGNFNKRDEQGAAPLHVAACNGYTSVVKFLVNQGKVDLNIKDNEGNTPLHLAVYFNEYEPALQLMLAGADTATLNNFGQTAIVLTEDATMLRLLSAVGKQTADVDVRGIQSDTLKRSSSVSHRKRHNNPIPKDAADGGRFA